MNSIKAIFVVEAAQAIASTFSGSVMRTLSGGEGLTKDGGSGSSVASDPIGYRI